MKHIVISGGWTFENDPFSAYKVSMVYGHNQRCRRHIGVNGVEPNEEGILPEDGFQVAKHKEDGSIIIVKGDEDKTNRCLLFVGTSGGFRGGVQVLEEGTTGKIISTCSASNACDSGISVAAILDVDQSVAFYSYGRRTDRVEIYTWNGTEVDSKTWKKQDWDRRNDPNHSEDNINWFPGNYLIFQVSGSQYCEGVTLDDKGELTRSLFNSRGVLAHGFNASADDDLSVVRFGKDFHDELVIAPANGEADRGRCAILVHEFSPGTGAKRWPGFYIDWDNAGEIEKLAYIRRGRGSGNDEYTLIIAPIGWAENVSSQFVSERDYPTQTIAYNPNGGKFEHPFNPFQEEGEAIAEAVVNLLGGSRQVAYHILKEESEAPYGRTKRQNALVENVPGIEDDPIASSLIYQSGASKLNNLLREAVIYLEKDSEEEKEQVKEESAPVEHVAPSVDSLASLAQRFGK